MLAFASASFAVESSAVTGAGLDGDLMVAPVLVGSGAPLVADFSLANHGNADMPELGDTIQGRPVPPAPSAQQNLPRS